MARRLNAGGVSPTRIVARPLFFGWVEGGFWRESSLVLSSIIRTNKRYFHLMENHEGGLLIALA